MRRRVLFAVAILASALTFCVPLWLANARSNRYWLLLCLVTVPACQSYWDWCDSHTDPERDPKFPH
jgi:hypothetical protein